MLPIRSAVLQSILDQTPPDLLFHYTSGYGLVGMLEKQAIWATNAIHLNDAREMVEASEAAALSALNLIRRPETPEDERVLLERMEADAGAAAPQVYVASFTSEGDSLEQWRAYCPPMGGYAVGIPSNHLMAVAQEQDFQLIKCVYDHTTKHKIIREVILSFLNEYREARAHNLITEEYKKNLVWRFYQHVAQIGAVMKHKAFAAELEWRLISPPISSDFEKIRFRGSASGIVPYYSLDLSTEQNPLLGKDGDVRFRVMVGPTPDPRRSSLVAQMLLKKHLRGAEACTSSIPYRSW